MFSQDPNPEKEIEPSAIKVVEHISREGGFGFKFFLNDEELGYFTYASERLSLLITWGELDLRNIKLSESNLRYIRGMLTECFTNIMHVHEDKTGRPEINFLFNLPINNPYLYKEETEKILDYMFPRSTLDYSEPGLFCFKAGALNNVAEIKEIHGSLAKIEYNDELTDEEDIPEVAHVENLTGLYVNVEIRGNVWARKEK